MEKIANGLKQMTAADRAGTKRLRLNGSRFSDQLLLAGVESDPGDAAADRPGLRPAQLIPRPQPYPGSTGQLSGLSLADPFALKPNLKLLLFFYFVRLGLRPAHFIPSYPGSTGVLIFWPLIGKLIFPRSLIGQSSLQ